jgi:nitroreductase
MDPDDSGKFEQPCLPELDPPCTGGAPTAGFPPLEAGDKPAIIQAILRRRSIRRYQPRPIERQDLDWLLEAAMAAPSACNSQPWEFVVVTEANVLDSLRDRLQSGRYNATAAIVVCGNLKIAHNSAARRFWVQDCSASAENILLAAAGLGLGAVWIGVYPLPSLVKAVSEVLGMPEHVTPLCLILLGYPDEDKPARTQYDPRRVYWQAYEPRKARLKKKNAKKL